VAARRIAAFITLACVWSAPAFAQGTPRERVAVTIGVSAPVASTSFSHTITFETFSEEGSLTTLYPAASRPRLNLGGAVRLWHGLGAGIAATTSSGSDTAQITGQIPHPINPNQPRALTGSVETFHRESAIHVQAVYWFQPAARIDVLLSGGPSFMHVDQDLVSDVSYTQSFPYDIVSFAGASLTRESARVTGAHAGADIGVRLVSGIGVAGVFRYSKATATFPDASGASMTLGGFEIGGGLHLTF